MSFLYGVQKSLIYTTLLFISNWIYFELAPLKEDIIGLYAPSEERFYHDPEPLGDFSYVNIPFKRVGNLILLEAKVDSTTGYFILDTGAPYLVLNNTYFRDYPNLKDQKAVSITNREENVFATRVDSFRLRSIRYKDLTADVADLSHIENKKGVPIFGLIGTSLLKKFVLSIHYKEQYITIYNPENIADQLKRPHYTIPFSLKKNAIFIKGSINNQPLRFLLDTGAELNVIGNNLNSKVDEAFQIQRRTLLTGSLGEDIEVFSGILNEIRIQESTFSQMKTIMTNLDGAYEIYEVTVDGILGYEWLRKEQMLFNFPEKEIYIYKSSADE